jgi:hypothetical protein
MNRMPCSITDDPQCDASDFYEKEGVYKETPEPNPDDQYDKWVEDQLFNKLKSSLEPLITPHVGDKK